MMRGQELRRQNSKRRSGQGGASLIPALRRQRQEICECEVSLVHRVSSRTARDTQRNPVSKNKQRKRNAVDDLA